MATPFEDIYARAIFRFADHDFLKKDIQVRESVLEQYLISAKTEFQRMCNIDLDDYDIDFKQFNQTLDDEVIDILSLGIAYYWISYKALNSELLKNVLNSKEYYYYSPGNLLKEIQALRNTLKNEFYMRMRQHSYNNNTLSTLKHN